jgi:hypothetical protein
VQRLDERRRDTKTVGKLLGLSDDVPDQLEEAVSDFGGLLICAVVGRGCRWHEQALHIKDE